MKRFFCLFLLMLVVMLPMVSCNSNNNANNSDSPDGENEMIKDFGGVDYTILAREETAYEVDNSGEGTDDKVQRKIWERNVTMKDAYNVNIVVVPCPGVYGEKATYIAKARSLTSSGSDEVSLFFTHYSYMQEMAMEGMGVALSKIPQIDISEDWWCEKYNDNSEMFGKNYVFVGDMGITLYEYLEVVFFNKKFQEMYQIGDLYQLVLDGKWTLDEMIRLSKLAIENTNVNVSEEERVYGTLSNEHAIRAFASCLGFEYARLNGIVNEYELHTAPPQLMDDTYSKLLDWHMSDAVRYTAHGGTDSAGSNPLFANDKSLFYIQTLGEAEYLAANMNSGYGVLPYPKLDDTEGTDYHSTTRDSISGCMVANTVEDLEMVGTVTEAMCKYARDHITTEYYEQRLKFRYFDDHQTKAMLDMIRENLTFEFTQIFGDVIGRPYDSFSDVANSNAKNLESETLTHYWKSKLPTWKSGIADMYEKFSKLGR